MPETKATSLAVLLAKYGLQEDEDFAELVKEVSELEDKLAHAEDMVEVKSQTKAAYRERMHKHGRTIDRLLKAMDKLLECNSGHTRLFLTSREKMHANGVMAWDEAVKNGQDAVRAAREEI